MREEADVSNVTQKSGTAEDLGDEDTENRESADNVERERGAVSNVTQTGRTAEDAFVLSGIVANVGDPRGECQYREPRK